MRGAARPTARLLEEPVKTGPVEALLEVTAQSPVPIATGEKLFALGQFRPLIDERAALILQPDLTHCFGIAHLLEIARAAEAEQMLMAPHNAGGPSVRRRPCKPMR